MTKQELFDEVYWAVGRFYRHQCGDGHEYVDTCTLYNFLQKLAREKKLKLKSPLSK